MIVDAHTHIFPPEIASGRERYVAADRWFALLYQAPRARIATGDGLVAAMGRAGVAHAVAASFGWRDASIGFACTDYMLAERARSDGRVLPLAYVQPAMGAAGVARLEADLADGCVGIGELMPAGQGFDLDDHALLQPYLHLAAEARVPVMVHVSEPVGHPYPGKADVAVASMWRLAKSFPHVRFIAAHWGGGLPFYELMPEVRADLVHVWYDTAATSYLYDARIFRTVVDLAGAGRVLFASDYPLLRYGRLMPALERAGLAPDEAKLVMGENAARLFRLPAGPEVGVREMPSGDGEES